MLKKMNQLFLDGFIDSIDNHDNVAKEEMPFLNCLLQ
jgi:hypothetical protein